MAVQVHKHLDSPICLGLRIALTVDLFRQVASGVLTRIRGWAHVLFGLRGKD